MNGTTFAIKRNDTGYALQYALSPVTDLTGASVVFTMADVGGTKVIDRRAATIVSPPTSGIVQHNWLAGDTATAGTFSGEFEITFPSGQVITFPNQRNITIKIAPDLG